MIGANGNAEKLNQFWIDKDTLLVLLLIKYDNNIKGDVMFEDHVLLQGGWVDTKCGWTG